MTHLAPYRHSATCRRLIHSLIPIVCPPDHARFDVADAVVTETELGMRAMPAMVRHALVAGMLTYDLSAVARFARRAHRLRDARAAAHYRAWKHGLSVQREFIKGIKGIIAMAYYEQPAVLDAMGYDPAGWIQRVAARRLARYSDAIAAHQDACWRPDPVPLPGAIAARIAATTTEAS